MIQITAMNNEDKPVVIVYRGDIEISHLGGMLFVNWTNRREDDVAQGSDFFYMADIVSIIGKEG